MKTIDVQGLDTIFVTGSMEEMESIKPILETMGFTQIKDRPNAYQFETGMIAPLANAFDEDPKITFMGMPISKETADKISAALIEEVRLKVGAKKPMKKITATDIPVQLNGFVGGMGYKSILKLTSRALGFEFDSNVRGYISEPVNGIHYAEVMQSNGDADYMCGELDDVQKWVTYKVSDLTAE